MVEFSFQLYSARKFPPLEAQLRKLAEIGYTQVEGYGAVYEEAERAAAIMKEVGLTMPTGHFGLDLLNKPDLALKIADTFGIRTLICPAVPQGERRQPDDGWKRLAATLARLNETYRAAGYGFGWHNHAFEFAPTATGAIPMRLILDGAPEIGWEMDVGWLVHGGADANEWLDRYGKRIFAVHIKDWAPEGTNPEEDGQADVGHGTLDWQALFTAVRSRSSAQYFIMEHDNPSDYVRYATRSLAAARSWK